MARPVALDLVETVVGVGSGLSLILLAMFVAAWALCTYLRDRVRLLVGPGLRVSGSSRRGIQSSVRLCRVSRDADPLLRKGHVSVGSRIPVALGHGVGSLVPSACVCNAVGDRFSRGAVGEGSGASLHLVHRGIDNGGIGGNLGRSGFCLGGLALLASKGSLVLLRQDLDRVIYVCQSSFGRGEEDAQVVWSWSPGTLQI